MSKDYRIIWSAESFLNKVNAVAEEVSKKSAERVLRDARLILKGKTTKHGTGKLASEIEIIKSKYKQGGYIIWAQPPGGYDRFYATFVELGHYSSVYGKYKRKGVKSLKGISPIYIERQPYLRPALRKNKQRIHRMFKKAMQ